MSSARKERLATTSRNLLLVTFITLIISSFFFLLAITYVDRSNREIFSHVEISVNSIARSSELNRMLVELELDIREMINIILREPYRLSNEKEALRARFERIEITADNENNTVLRQKLLNQLNRYRIALDMLLWDFGTINSGLYEVYYYLNNFMEKFGYLEENVMMRTTDNFSGSLFENSSQTAALINQIKENILQIHILVDSSLRNNDPGLLVDSKENSADSAGVYTVLDKLTALSVSLRSLMAAHADINGPAGDILETAPIFRESVKELSRAIVVFKENYSEFMRVRDASLQLLDEVHADDRNRLLAINHNIREQGGKTRFTAWLIAFAVLLFSIVGLLVTRKMSNQLESTANEAISARDKVENLNYQLKREVEERRKVAEDLRLARDDLESRVRERTIQLSASNRSLALEIEERKNAEYALASEKERLTVTLRSIGDGVITTGINGSVVLVNKAAEQLTGWSQQEAYGRPVTEIFDIVHKKTGEKCENPVDGLLRTGSICNLMEDTVLIARDGTRRDIADSGAPIRDRNSMIIGAVIVFRDITEKRKMEEEALKAEKLKSVGVLAGGIAHDFNNILAAILGNISLAKLHMEEEAVDRARVLLDDAEKASLRARNLTQQLLTFSKGGEPIRKVESVREIIIESAKFILSGGKVHTRYDIADELWPVNIDAGQMSQVIQNIIINALHAMPEGGMIEISCRNFVNDQRQVLALGKGSYIRIAIKDQGTGIPEELLGKIFDPYFTTKKEGSGLGLALTHSIIGKHQGHIEVETGSRGTTFAIYLPALPGQEVEEIPACTGEKAAASLAKVLIMDDEPMVRDIAREMLVHLGFTVETVNNGQEAVTLYQAAMENGSPVDIVIMDLTIPGGMGGAEAIRQLRKIDPAVKAIVSSGYSNDPVMSDYSSYGFSGMVSKPFQLRELHEAVLKVLA